MKNLTLVVALLFCIIISSFSQSRFRVIIKFPESIDTAKLTLAYDNGKSEIPVKGFWLSKYQIEISEIFYGKYAAIIFRYPKNINSQYQNSFFVSVKPAIIELNTSTLDVSPFHNYKLTNAIDFRIEKERLLDYDSVERKMISDLLTWDSKRNNHIEDSIFYKKFNSYNMALLDRDLEYVLNNNTSYYSFWFFRRNIMPSSILAADSLLYIFNSRFPKEFKSTEEGNSVRKNLLGRMALQAKKMAPLFTTQSIEKKTIKLLDFRGKKNVLIVFWATWCRPCLEEIPIIKQIRKDISKAKLEIIYIGYPSDYMTYLKYIKQESMEWVHVFNDVDLINAYGGYEAIPRIYLIDTTGKIIYNRKFDDVYDKRLNNLVYILETIALGKNK